MPQDPALLLQQLNTLQSQILELAATSNLSPMPIVGEETSLKDLKALLQRLSAPQPTSVRQQAVTLLDRFLTLVHQDQPHFPPLVGYQEQVRQFRTKILSLPESALPPDASNLVQGQHPVAVLLNLVERGSQISDTEWTRLSEIVSKAMGQEIATAVSRGKLLLQPTASTPQPVAAVQATAKPAADAFIWGAPAPQPAAAPKAPEPITFGAKSLGLSEVDLTPGGALGIKILVHIQGIGDREFGSQEFAGTRGQSKGIEGFQIELTNPIPGVQLEYMAHLAGVGDTPWIPAGRFVGTRGENRRLEGLAIRLTGSDASKYDVCYVGHIQDVGDTPVLSNGTYCGTRGRALRVEAIKVWIQGK